MCGLTLCAQQQDRFHILGNAGPGNDERVGDRNLGIREDAGLHHLRRANTELRTRGPEVRIVEDNQPIERRERDALPADALKFGGAGDKSRFLIERQTFVGGAAGKCGRAADQETPSDTFGQNNHEGVGEQAIIKPVPGAVCGQ